MESCEGWLWQGYGSLTFHNMLCNADIKCLLLAGQQAGKKIKESMSGNVTDGQHSGDERPCNSTLLGRVTEKKGKDGWPGQDSSSKGRDVLPSDFTQL